MNKSQKKHLTFWIRMLIASVFLLSGVLKLISIDQFEIYLFSLKIFNFNLSALAARILISFELIIGILILIKLFQKIVWYLTMGILICFSVFLLIQIFQGVQANCQCFGDLVHLSPFESLIKNLLILVLMVFIKGHEPIKIKYPCCLLAIILLFCLVVPMVYSLPDFIYMKHFADSKTPKSADYLSELPEHIQKKSPRLRKGKTVFCLFSTKCKFCDLAATKISLMATRQNIEPRLLYGFFQEKPEIVSFLKEHESQHISYITLPIPDFFRIAQQQVPGILFIDNGRIIDRSSYRKISEKKLVQWFE